MKKYMSGQQALDDNLITEAEWQSAIAHPWTWIIVSNGLKMREIPWQGLELENILSLEDVAHEKR